MKPVPFPPYITIIDEHSVCLDLLPEKAAILDCGCRGMGFNTALTELGHRVFSIDIDDLGISNYMKCGLYFHAGKAKITQDEDPQARKITDVKLFDPKKPVPKIAPDEVYLITIQGAAIAVGVKQFDLIKLDIEGAEYIILQNAKHPIAKMLSVEFHGHCGQSKEQLDHLLKYLSEWYEIHGAVWEKRHGCSENYWDVLLIQK